MKQAIKRAVLPGPAARRLPFGIARGVRMHIDPMHQSRIYLGLYELELNRFLGRMLTPGVSAFDVGAEHGYDSLLIANRTRSPVVAFECDEANLDGMRTSFTLNPALAPHIKPVMAMVGNSEDTLRLDDYAFGPDGFVPDLLKIDIEGAEADALRGAERILHSRHPALVVETHSAALEEECGRILVRHGYRPKIVSQRRLWADHRPTPEQNRWLVCE